MGDGICQAEVIGNNAETSQNQPSESDCNEDLAQVVPSDEVTPETVSTVDAICISDNVSR